MNKTSMTCIVVYMKMQPHDSMYAYACLPNNFKNITN